MHRSDVKVNNIGDNYHFKGLFDLSNTHNTFGNGNFAPNVLIRSLGVQHANYMSSLNN